MTALRDAKGTVRPSGPASGREKVVERLVAWIWERQLLVGSLSADDGHAYRVVFRGRSWGERGPDFQGAIVARDDGVLLRGDVEIHVRASDWRKHGHGRDPAYNQAACHVVLWRDDARPTLRQDGVAIPTLELIGHLAAPIAELERRMAADRPLAGRAYASRTRPARERTESPAQSDASPPTGAADARPPHLPLDAGPPRPATETQLSLFELPVCVPAPEELGALLDRAGLARFHERSAAFEGNLAALDPAEVLYRGVARAMGYTANTAGFERLAEAVPLASLAEIADPIPDTRLGRLVAVQAALLGGAGLLPSQRGLAADHPWLRALEAAWPAVRGHVCAPLPPDAWRTWRVRPDNLPARRVAGLSQLVADLLLAPAPTSTLTSLAAPERHGAAVSPDASGILDRLLADLDNAERTRRPARLSVRWQVRAADVFWASHYDVGRPTSGEHAQLVGAGRADELAVNVLLPFLHALGQARGDAELSERALALYRAYPSTAPNRLTREMARQLGGPSGAKVARGAARQQGLIHLYRRWCDMHDCETCAARVAQNAR